MKFTATLAYKDHNAADALSLPLSVFTYTYVYNWSKISMMLTGDLKKILQGQDTRTVDNK